MRLRGDRRHRGRESSEQHAEAPDVRPLLARLGDGAADHVVDPRRVEPRARRDAAQRVREQRIGTGIAVGAAALGERRADCGDDDGFGHGRGSKNAARIPRVRPAFCITSSRPWA